jgi:hypothetical protein
MHQILCHVPQFVYDKGVAVHNQGYSCIIERGACDRLPQIQTSSASRLIRGGPRECRGWPQLIRGWHIWTNREIDADAEKKGEAEGISCSQGCRHNPHGPASLMRRHTPGYEYGRGMLCVVFPAQQVQSELWATEACFIDQCTKDCERKSCLPLCGSISGR